MGGVLRVRFLFVSPAFPLISLFNELERQLGTRSLPRDPGSLEPVQGRRGQEGGPRLPLEQDTGLRSQAQPGPVGVMAGLRRLSGSQSQLLLSAPPDLQVTGAVARSAHIRGGISICGEGFGAAD